MEYLNRKNYVNQLNMWRDKRVVKVITGLRRSGKSTLMMLFQRQLRANGVDESHIISVNFEDVASEPLLEYHALHDFVSGRIEDDAQYYIFFDEIQQVAGFERVVDSLQLRQNVDIYVTGSNAYMLSGEIATLLSGRYVEIHVLPLSMAEMIEATGLSAEKCYNRFITSTTLPYVLQLPTDEAIRVYLQNIYQTIVIKDVMKRGRVQESDAIDRLVRYMADNIGNMTSIKGIADAMAAGGCKISPHTVETYVGLLTESYLFYRVPRYDAKGKELLRTGQKYYLSDVGLRTMLLGLRGGDLGRLLENIVYLHLIRSGHKVMVGKSGDKEIDFIRFKDGLVEYYQVALTVRDEQTLTREIAPLNSVKDHNPKFLLTMDSDPEISHNGIRQIYALDWLARQ